MRLRSSVAAIALLAAACADAGETPQAAAVETAPPPIEAPLSPPPRRPAVAPLPAADSVLTRIAFGSCVDEESPQPIWASVLAADPDLFLLIGDNIYADIHEGEFVDEVTPEVIARAYETMARHPDFSPFRSRVPILGAWDDHDYGLNDGGREYEYKAESKELMLDFFGLGAGDPVRQREGLYYARSFGPEGRRVQIIMLDTRWFRSGLTETDERGAPGKERYLPSQAEEQVILGEAQWAWLEEQLRQPADLRLLVSSIQALAEGHGWELWGNLPKERQRLFELIRSTAVEDLILLSGDRHTGGLYRLEGAAGYPLYEITSSSLNKSFAEGLTIPEMGPHQLGLMYAPENFGMITIDWERQTLAMDLRDEDGATVRALTISLKDLKNPD